MNGQLWLKFFVTAHNPVFYEGQSYVDLNLFSNEVYPALKILKQDHSTLEILLLAQLILNAEQDDREDRLSSEVQLYELFENYDCTSSDILQALRKLEQKGWIEIFVEQDSAELYCIANLAALVKDGIYTFINGVDSFV